MFDFKKMALKNRDNEVDSVEGSDADMQDEIEKSTETEGAPSGDKMEQIKALRDEFNSKLDAILSGSGKEEMPEDGAPSGEMGEPGMTSRPNKLMIALGGK